GKPLKPAVFARLALEDGGETQRIQLLLALKRTVDLAPVDSADVAAIGSLCKSNRAALRGKGYEVLVRARGPGRGALLVQGLDDPDASVRELVARELPACDTDVAFELLVRDPLEPRVASALEAFDKRVLALAAVRASEAKEARIRSLGVESVKKLRPVLEALAADEKDPGVAARIRDALAR